MSCMTYFISCYIFVYCNLSLGSNEHEYDMDEYFIGIISSFV